MNNILALVLKGSQVISVLAPITLELALQLKAIFAQTNPDIQMEIRPMQAGAIQTAEETISMIDAWKKANGQV